MNAFLALLSKILPIILPEVLKLILAAIDKNKSPVVKDEYLKFLVAVENEFPLKLHEKYDLEIAAIKTELGKKNGQPKDSTISASP